VKTRFPATTTGKAYHTLSLSQKKYIIMKTVKKHSALSYDIIYGNIQNYDKKLFLTHL
jgi:hypothetical protein